MIQKLCCIYGAAEQLIQPAASIASLSSPQTPPDIGRQPDPPQRASHSADSCLQLEPEIIPLSFSVIQI